MQVLSTMMFCGTFTVMVTGIVAIVYIVTKKD